MPRGDSYLYVGGPFPQFVLELPFFAGQHWTQPPKTLPEQLWEMAGLVYSGGTSHETIRDCVCIRENGKL